MDKDDRVSGQAPQLRVARVFPASRARLFAAWSGADQVKRWFSPETYSVPEAVVDMRVGGVFDLCMRSPAGETHLVRGTFVEVVANERLAIDMRVQDGAGAEAFRVMTIVTFADAEGGARMEVTQTYTFVNAAAAESMVQGAHEGWRTTLDKLELEIADMTASETAHSVVHATFEVERVYDAPVARVWAALVDESAKSKWFVGPAGKWRLVERRMDVRVGGCERLVGRWEGGSISAFDAIYHDVVARERLIYTYEMTIDGKKISVSLATMQLGAMGSKTRLHVVEQGAFLDGYDDSGARAHGTNLLLDALGASLQD